MTSPAHTAQLVYQLPTDAFGSPALVNPGQEPGQPGAPERADGLPNRGSVVLMTSLDELDAARPHYATADNMYDGEVGDSFASEQVARLLAKAGVNEVEDFNYAKVPVDAITEKLQIRAVTVAAGDQANNDETDDQSGVDSVKEQGDPETVSTTGGPKKNQKGKNKISEAAQEAIDKLRARNQLEAEEGELHLKAGKHGDAYLFVWPVVSAPDEEEAFEDAIELDQQHQGRTVSVDMFVNSAYTTRMFYDPENPLRATHVLKSWEWIDEQNDMSRRRATLYFKDRIERWVVKPGGDAGLAEDWEPYLEDEEEWPAPNPTERLPFFHFRNARTYGKPEHLSAYGPQRLINKLISAHAVTVDYQSFPQRYALIDPRADDVLQNFIDPDNPEDDDDDPEGDGRSQLRADPAAVWKMTASSVGQFGAADPSVFMDPLDRYIKSISELCGIPLDRFVGYSQPPSGEARRAGNEVLYEKAGSRTKNYGSTWNDAYEFALELLGITDVTVTVQWKPFEVASGTDDWSVITQKIANGVPVKQCLMEAGYPEDEVEKWLLDQGGADLVRRVALLNQVGTAIQAMAAGVAVGLVSSEQAGDIISRIIGAVGDELPDLDEPVELFPQMANMQMDLQAKQRGQQMTEHAADAPPEPLFDPQGRAIKQAPKRPLPPPPEPPKPVKVGRDT